MRLIRDHYTSSTLNVEKAGLVKVHTTLEGPIEYVTTRWMSKSTWFLHGIEWIMFYSHLDYFQKPPLGGKPKTKPGDHGTSNAHNHWFILFYHVWGPAWIELHSNSIWLGVWLHMPSHYTWGSMSILHDFERCLGTTFGHFLLGSQNFMIIALGSFVKWP